MYRNFIRGPKYISLALFATCYLAYWVFIPWTISLWWIFFGSVGWGIVGLAATDMLANALTRVRIANWADEYQGVPHEDIELFLKDMSPEELDSLVAQDLEGEGWDDQIDQILKE